MVARFLILSLGFTSLYSFPIESGLFDPAYLVTHTVVEVVVFPDKLSSGARMANPLTLGRALSQLLYSSLTRELSGSLTPNENRKISPEPDMRITVGFHGTSKELAELALKDKGLLVSRDPGDWLGEGAYFWENSSDKARQWARERHGDAAAVLKAEIQLGRCLDLTDSKWVDAAKAAFQELEIEHKAKGTPLPKNKGFDHYKDYAAIRLLCERKFSVDTVRGAFGEHRELGGFQNLAHVQIAVRNPEMIVSLELSYPLPYKAYLASALTGLGQAQRGELDARQTLIKEVCVRRGIDLYIPAEKTDPERHKDVPPDEVFFADIREVLNSDLFILMTDHPSFGAGIELKSALEALLPIILVTPKEVRLSRMVLGIPSQRRYDVRYESHEDLKAKLDHGIGFLMQNVVDRKDKLKRLSISLGATIRTLRDKNGFSREQVAAAVGITQELLARIEESPDYLTNPSLLLLTRLAEALDTRVADVVDPEYFDVVAHQAFQLDEETGFSLETRHGKGPVPAGDKIRILRARASLERKRERR